MPGEYLNRPPEERKYSAELLASTVVAGLVLCAKDQIDGEGPDPITGDSFRLTTYVKSEDERLGDALAISAPHPAPGQLISCQLYRVDRDRRQIINNYPKKFAVSNHIATRESLDAQKDSLMSVYDTDELEATLSLLRKAGSVYSGAANDYDKIVFNAVVDPYLDELASRDRAKRQLEPNHGEDLKPVSDSHRFIKVAESYLGRQSTDITDLYALQYEHHDGSFYLLKLKQHLGNLSVLTIARRNDQQNWQAAEFDLIGDSDIDELDRALEWDEKALIETVRQGKLISNQTFEAYLQEAAQANFPADFQHR